LEDVEGVERALEQNGIDVDGTTASKMTADFVRVGVVHDRSLQDSISMV
jgi:hypothetical protein